MKRAVSTRTHAPQAPKTRAPGGRASNGGFVYRPRARRPARQFSRKVLLAAALEEFRSGEDAVAALYASLLIRALADAQPGLADEFGAGLAALEG